MLLLLAFLVACQDDVPDFVATNTPRPTPSLTLPLSQLQIEGTENAPLTAAAPTAEPFPTTDWVSERPTVDADAIRASREGTDFTSAFNKIGLQVGVGANMSLLNNWMQRHDEARVPLFIASVDNVEVLVTAQALRSASGVDHTLIYRDSTFPQPDYDSPAIEAAQTHWASVTAQFPSELDKSVVWLQTLNEPDPARAEWVAEFGLEQARLALADGYRYAAFGWAVSEPERDGWENAPMLQFLRVAAENPEQIALSLDEHSLAESLLLGYPFNLGRFLGIFEVADDNEIGRPTILITRWGWQRDSLPELNRAMDELQWANTFYTAFPTIKGVALSALASDSPTNDAVETMIDPLLNYSLSASFVALRETPFPPDPNSFLP